MVRYLVTAGSYYTTHIWNRIFLDTTYLTMFGESLSSVKVLDIHKRLQSETTWQGGMSVVNYEQVHEIFFHLSAASGFKKIVIMMLKTSDLWM